MKGLKVLVQKDFQTTFDKQPDLIAQAPGRVNLIGEHTDYNDGFVLPCAIDFQTVVAASKRRDRLVRVRSLDYQDTDEFTIAPNIQPLKDKLWANYIRGVILTLLQSGYEIGGVDIAVSGNVPKGAGLSSSASLEIAVVYALTSLFTLELSANELAAVGQHAENNFVGCNCGIMDQTIAVRGQAGHAMLLDCRNLKVEFVAIPKTFQLLIVNSNQHRGLVDSAYNERRAQCQHAANLLGVNALRDVTTADLEEKIHKLEPIVARRARHVITENERTQLAAYAIKDGNEAELSRLMAASHISMRDDFEITTPEIDYLVEIINTALGEQGGVRMTGGGFGGCVVALIPTALTGKIISSVREDYPHKSGIQADFYLCRTATGASLLERQ